MSDILERILAVKRAEVASAQAARPLELLRRDAQSAPVLHCCWHLPALHT